VQAHLRMMRRMKVHLLRHKLLKRVAHITPLAVSR
jgi:hypothetical protein